MEKVVELSGKNKSLGIDLKPTITYIIYKYKKEPVFTSSGIIISNYMIRDKIENASGNMAFSISIINHNASLYVIAKHIEVNPVSAIFQRYCLHQNAIAHKVVAVK